MEVYTLEPHRPINLKGISWRVCAHCGLVYLNNRLTKWCIEKGCNSRDYPGYQNKVKELGKRD